MSDDSDSFELLMCDTGIDVVLGDGTPYTLNFHRATESPYLSRLLSMGQRLTLTFGTAAAVKELEGIVACQQRSAASQRAAEMRNSGHGSNSRQAAKSVPAPARNESGCATTSTNPTATAIYGMDAASRERVRNMSQDRRLFMEVLELATRLEVTATIPLLCDAFRRIFATEVRPQADACALGVMAKGTVAFHMLSEDKLRSFRQYVIRAFALEAVPRETSRLSNTRGAFYDESVAWRVPADRYFFATLQDVGDLTQSVDPQLSSRRPSGRACFETIEASVHGHPFQIPAWEADDVARVCALCGRSFASWSTLSFGWVQATHCRCCGRRVCTNCSPCQLDQSIARLSKPGGPAEGPLRRACKMCCRKAERLNKNAFLCGIFIRAGLTLTEVALLRSVNESWCGAAELCLGDYRSVLYLNTSRFSEVPPQTAQLLANSVSILIGHPEALCFHILSLNWSDEQAVAAAHDALCRTVNDAKLNPKLEWKPHISHWHMLCTRSCALTIPSFFAIKLLEALHRAPSENSTAEAMRTLVWQELLLNTIAGLDERVRGCLVPMLFDLLDLSSCEFVATSVLREIAQLDRRLAIVICQESLTRGSRDELRYVSLRNLVINGDQKRGESHVYFSRTLEFLRMLAGLSYHRPDKTDETRAEFRKNLYNAGLTAVDLTTDEFNSDQAIRIQPMFFPFDTDVLITKIDINKIQIMESKQRPFTIPLIDSDDNVRRILFKRESLEKDKVMCITSRFLQWVLQKDLGNVKPPTYHVLSLSSTSGVIEIVEGGRTIQNIIDKNENRLLQYLEQQEEKKKEEEQSQKLSFNVDRSERQQRLQKTSIRECFLHSAKFFILLNYMFAIGDRHRDNVMIHENGAIFHIDFSMLLNTTTFEERITSSYVRFDRDLEACVLDIMKGNASSSDPEEVLDVFFMETAAWFLDVRPYVGIIHQLLSHVVHRRALDGVNSLETLAALMGSIFMRDAADETCKRLFVERVKRSRGRSWLKDLTHETHKRAWGALSQGYQWMCYKTGINSKLPPGYIEDSGREETTEEQLQEPNNVE